MNIFKLMLMTTAAHICMAADDGNNGGGGDGGDKGGSSLLDTDKIKTDHKNGGDPAPGAETKTAEQLAAEEVAKNKPADQPGQKETRPDWLKADKFWDAEKGSIKTEELHKSFVELEKKFHNGDHKAPAKAEDYKLNISDEQKTVLFGSKDADVAADPYIKGATEWAAKHKISQDALNEFIGMYAELVGPETQKMQIDIEAEKSALGKNADAIIKNQMDFFGQLYKSGVINDKHLAELRILGETAAGIQAIQKIREFYGEQPMPMQNTAGEGMPTKQELSAMLNDPKYDTDADYKAKVDGLYTKMYGNAPAMSSAQNR